MKIPEKQFKKWELLRSHGDNKKISELNKDIIEMDISRAFANGECSQEVFVAMASFYKEREKMIKAYL